MDPERWRRIRALFEEALTLREDARAAFLAQACVGDATLHAEVAAMLAADAHASHTVDGLRVGLADAAPDLLRALTEDDRARERDQLVGRRLGAWRLQREIGRGGMGAVYLAERADGEYAQQAAVKLVRPGWDAAEQLARFRAERQILATFAHPNIARLLDGGVSDDGKPYLVLEYVDGATLVAHCDARALAIAPRLALFLTVCDAVAHAHRALVVHRDLKPSNILVDRDGTVKLLDFGIARLLEGDASRTASALRAFTPEYAAPEQVRGDPVTTGVDVYALGLLLFELLTGQRPYRVDGSTPAAYEQAILTQEPPRPSRVASAHEPDSARLAQERASDPSTLGARLRGDLDAIVLKALRKDPTARYASVEALADDVRRYLAQQPVHARQGDLRYRATRFLQRHALAVTFATVAALSLVAGLGFSLWQAAEARAQRDIARAESAKSREALRFLEEVFTAADPGKSDGGVVTARDLLDQGSTRIRDALSDAPASRAILLLTLSRAYNALAMNEPALANAKAALADARRLDDPALLVDALVTYGNAQSASGLYPDAIRAVREADRVAARLGSSDDDELLRSRVDSTLAPNLINVGELAEAEQRLQSAMARRARVLGPNHPKTIEPAGQYAFLLMGTGRTGDAIALLRRLMPIARAAKPLDTDNLINFGSALSTALSETGNDAEEEALLRETLALTEGIYGPDSRYTMNGLLSLAEALTLMGRTAEAEPMYVRVIETHARTLGPRHSWAAHGHAKYSLNLAAQGRLDEALAQRELALSIRRETRGEASQSVATDLVARGALHRERGELVEAKADLDAAIAILLTGQQRELALADALLERQRIAYLAGTLDAGCADATRAVALREAAREADAQAVAQARVELGACRLANHDVAGARVLFDGAADAAIAGPKRLNAWRPTLARYRADLAAALRAR